jgi:organic radical activating enzyme
MNKLLPNTFCYLPFGSIFVFPNGKLHPCCIASPFKEDINYQDFNSIDEVINSEPYKRIRKEMLDGIAPSECAECFIYKNQHKENSNREFYNEIGDPGLYNSDYSVNKIVYTDLRLSNHCNFRCRMCYHGSSSSWYDYWGYVMGKPDYNDTTTRIITAGEDGIGKFSEKNIDSIRKIYLAGGEPFITPTTFELLDRFTNEQASNVSVLVNTNLSNLTYKGIDILEKLSKFKSINLSCSCDGYGKIGEYQRPGFNTNKFFNNLETLLKFKETHPNFIVEIDYTISTINMYHTFDFIDFVGKNYLDSNKIKTHTVTQPFYFAPGACSPEVKKELVKFYEDKMRSLNYESNRSLLNTLVEFVKYLKVTNEEDVQNHLMSNKQHMSISLEETLRRFDEINNTSYKDVCPWLEEIFK